MEQAKYTAEKIAQWFIHYGAADSAPGDLSNLKLQKLLYYAQGWHMALKDQPLFPDEIQAWSHGPVINNLYHRFKHFGSGDVMPEPTSGFQWADIDGDTTDLLIEVWEKYAQFSAWKLRNMTHEEAPWRESWRPNMHNLVIPADQIGAYFKGIAHTA